MQTKAMFQRNEVSFEIYHEIVQFLNFETKLIDDRRFHDWLEYLSDDFDYRIPVRLTKYKKDGEEFSDKAYHFFEDYYTMKMRVDRLDSKHAWAEDPPSRTRHFISNITVKPSANNNEYNVTSNLLVYRGRVETVEGQLLSGERNDIIKKMENNSWKVVKRYIYLDHTTLPFDNLSIFI